MVLRLLSRIRPALVRRGCDRPVQEHSRQPLLDRRRASRSAGAARAGPAAELAWNPEFLREGHAVEDTLRPDRIVAGVQSKRTFARLHEAAHVIAVSNGSVALVAALRAHQIGPGDEVITSPLTFAATLNAILEAGATARFADVTGDLTLDPAALEALITPRTRAVLPVHLYGLPAATADVAIAVAQLTATTSGRVRTRFRDRTGVRPRRPVRRRSRGTVPVTVARRRSGEVRPAQPRGQHKGRHRR